MYTEQFDQWIKSSKNFATPLTEWNKTTTEMYRKVAQHQLETATENMARVSEQLRRLTSVKRPEDLLTIQKECLQENTTALINGIQSLLATSLESIDEFNKLCRTAHNEAPTSTTNKTQK